MFAMTVAASGFWINYPDDPPDGCSSVQVDGRPARIIGRPQNRWLHHGETFG
jgi:hypothetical protein